MITYAIVIDDVEGVCYGDSRERIVEIESPESIHLPSDEFIKSYIWNNKK